MLTPLTPPLLRLHRHRGLHDAAQRGSAMAVGRLARLVVVLLAMAVVALPGLRGGKRDGPLAKRVIRHQVPSSGGLTARRRMVPPKQSLWLLLRGGQEEDGVEGEVQRDANKNFLRENALELVDPTVRPYVKDLHSLQSEYEKFYEKHCDSVYELERKLCEQTQALYKKRSELIKKIPDFWALALTAHRGLKHAISDPDMEVLGYLEDIEVSYLEPPRRGFTLRFKFRKNPFFDHEELAKTYEMDTGPTLRPSSEIRLLEDRILTCIDSPELLSVESIPSEIEWKQGEPVKVDAEMPGSNATEKITRPRPSFFYWFAGIELSIMNTDAKTDKEIKLQDSLADATNADISIACAIKDELLPHAVEYFTGEREDSLALPLDDGEENELSDSDGTRDANEEAPESALENISSYEIGKT